MSPAACLQALWRRSEAYSRIAAYVAAVLVAAPFFYHVAHHSTAYLGLLEDDHFYYATVADNLAKYGKLSYDGTTLTNGFHPLWMGLIAALRVLCGGLGPQFYVALVMVSIVSMLLTYELGRRYAMTLGASARLSAAISAIYALGMARLQATGMECVAAVPLFMWWLIEIARPVPVTTRRAALLGFIASLAILARLDVAIAVAMVIVGYALLVRPRIYVLARQLLAFGAGGILVPAYLAANFIYFHTPLPVSALAKRLVVSRGFSLPYAWAVAFDTYYGPSIAVVLPLGAVALYVLVRRDRRFLTAARFSGAVALLFGFSFFFLNALSGWIFFGWYAYPLSAATIASLVFISQWYGSSAASERFRGAAKVAVLALVTLAPALAIRYYVQHGPKWSVRDNTLLAMSYDLADHMKNRHGLSAMGACAGIAAFVMDKPVLQLEGIITDRNLVTHIQRQDPLEEVLREYGVDYLIVSLIGQGPRRQDGCYIVTQPDAEWSGKRTAKMQGRICTEPVEHFFTEAGVNSWSQFPRAETLVWDIRSARWGRAEGRKAADSTGIVALNRGAQ